MAESLFNQLKKAGLVSEQKAKQVQKAKGKAQFQQTKQIPAKPAAGGEVCAPDDPVLLAAAAKAERARLLNRERQAQQVKKAALAEVRQLIETHRLRQDEGTMRYQFVDGTTVKSMAVTPEVHQRLVTARLRIARFDGGYALIPAPAAEKIAQRATDVLVPQSGTHATHADHDYAEFEVPDDLIW